MINSLKFKTNILQDKGQFDLKGQGLGHKMLNTQLKLESSKSCCIHKESDKILSFMANLTLKVKVKVTSF